MASDDERTFLVEKFVPRLDELEAAAITSRLHSAGAELVEEGVVLRFVRSYALIDEETYLCIVAGRDEDCIVRLNARARFDCDHVVEVVAFDPP
jgi:Protein of unknown function (DUF4242)